MKRIITSISIIALLTACGENSSTNKTDNNESKDSADVAVEETISETEEEAPSFENFEDYILLNNKEELIAEFGEDALEDGESWYAEGTVKYDHTILTNPNNGNIIKFLWDEDGNLSSIEAHYYLWNEDYEVEGTQKVQSAHGFHTGMPINDLREWAGEDFNFSGFGWDYAGGIMSMPGDKFSECDTKIRLDLDYEAEWNDHASLSGDVELNTSMENVKSAPIYVEEIVLYKDNL